MRALLPSLYAVALSGSFSLFTPEQGGDAEPPLEMVFQFDGEQQEIVLDRPFELKIGDATHRCSVRERGSRFFDKGGIRMRYPAEFWYEFDHEIEGCDVYTLEGSETLIMVQIYDEELGPAKAVDGTVKAVLEKLELFEVEVVENKISLGEHKFVAKTLQISVEPETLGFTQSYFAFPFANGTCVMCIQCGYTDNNSMSKESALAVSLIESSFEFDTEK